VFLEKRQEFEAERLNAESVVPCSAVPRLSSSDSHPTEALLEDPLGRDFQIISSWHLHHPANPTTTLPPATRELDCEDQVQPSVKLAAIAVTANKQP